LRRLDNLSSVATVMVRHKSNETCALYPRMRQLLIWN